MTTLSDALAAYRICAQAKGRSPRTIEWITSSVRYFADFLGEDKDISAITANDLRHFIITLQKCRKCRDHPVGGGGGVHNSPQSEKLSPLAGIHVSIDTIPYVKIRVRERMQLVLKEAM